MIPHPSTLISDADITIIRDNAAAAEELGQLHPAQLELIERLQWFKLLVPKVYGGLETPLPGLIRLQEAISWADGSLGWTMTLCCGAGWFGGFIDPVLAYQIFNTPYLCLAGSGAQTGVAEIVDDGYKISGTWKYATGAHHATHFTANCIIQKDGEIQQDEFGNALIRSFVIPAKDVELLPAWKYIGMIATGSHSFNIDGAVVSADHSFLIDPAHTNVDGKLYKYPFLQLAEATLAVNLSGMALHFIELCAGIFEQKYQLPKMTDAHKDLMRRLLQDVTSKMDIARTELLKAVDASWAAPLDANADELKAVSLTSRILATASREAVDKLYPYCGLIAAAADSEINRVWRDIHTAGQHSLLTFLDER
ncbi:acyl-CoA dehydrogenase family protein [Mucilaginibacter myungsuensis]|uniref:Acyl-CoA dehydrogenase n=1 Tax=Mucilaginibacter myungsuensis TaxID=649104 RepID=A0A929PW38_9SPHI|nr:acyl-CoA dehydrogenase [Mucilaginibacter myungsuensis]MBE9661671.1 acyl-CoA dehydrogenase [Mucilaginibacter myungsuensis]MDN3597815.1 acyl-CoA dehydrogenase [Mucilaginibacter myungsuensis]